MDAYIAELIGTMILIILGDGVVANVVLGKTKGNNSGWIVITTGWALAVFVAVYIVGFISGAHINPAVTIAFWSVRRFPPRDAISYVVAQCGGALLASLTLRWVLGAVGNLGATLPAITAPAAFAVEWLLSFILMFVIMAVATDARVADGFAGLAVGLTVGFDALVGGPLTGASMNPARSLGPAVAG